MMKSANRMRESICAQCSVSRRGLNICEQVWTCWARLESGERAVCKFTVWRNCEFRPLFHTSRTFIAPTHPIHRCTKEEHRESGRKLVCVETTVTLLIFNFNFKLAAEFDLSLVKSSQNGNNCRLRHA